MESYEPVINRKLFIGGINYHTTANSLKAVFKQWGEIVDVVAIKNNQTKRSRGFGFVTYAQSFMADEAMKNRPHIIDGRKVDTKRVVEGKDTHKPGIAANTKKMFIFNIREQSEHDLFEYFGKFGHIINTNIVIDKISGLRKGYGFIEYDNADSVDKAILCKSHLVAGEKLCVEKSTSRNGGGLRSRGGGGKYSDSVVGYNSNAGGAWQDITQIWDNNNPAWVNQEVVGYSWGDSQQSSNNRGPNNNYGGGGPIKSYYTTNYRTTPYGAGNVNTGNSSEGQNSGGQY